MGNQNGGFHLLSISINRFCFPSISFLLCNPFCFTFLRPFERNPTYRQSWRIIFLLCTFFSLAVTAFIVLRRNPIFLSLQANNSTTQYCWTMGGTKLLNKLWAATVPILALSFSVFGIRDKTILPPSKRSSNFRILSYAWFILTFWYLLFVAENWCTFYRSISTA